MENAPLTLAYTHARNAVQETKRSNPVAASEEHDLAAAEFATAAAATKDQEAVRILKLLEAHHRQLGHILKEAHLNPRESAKGERQEEKDSVSIGGKSTSTSQPPRLLRNRSGSGKEPSSSIAHDLASARGIPGNRPKRTLPVSPLVSNEHADAYLSTQDATDRGQSHIASQTRPPWTPPETIVSRVPVATSTADTNSAFQNFYSRFESTISALTAPLAFASLPLTQPESTPSAKDVKQTSSAPSGSPGRVAVKSEPSASTAIDFSQMISNAALRAVRDGSDPTSRPHESFYFVGPSAGQMSYADIRAANYVDRQVSREHRRNASNNSNDDFVDASSQFLSNARQPKPKTMEELNLENDVLRRTLNNVTKDLQVHQAASQHAAQMLAQSVRGLNLSPVVTPENSRGKTSNAMSDPASELAVRMQERRIAELEAALHKSERRMTKKDEENAKLKDTVGRYRTKWDELKSNAKNRRGQPSISDPRRSSTTTTLPTQSSPLASSSLKTTAEDGTDP